MEVFDCEALVCSYTFGWWYALRYGELGGSRCAGVFDDGAELGESCGGEKFDGYSDGGGGHGRRHVGRLPGRLCLLCMRCRIVEAGEVELELARR